MKAPSTAKWIGLALLGLAISGGVAIAASNLVSEQIGIASESVSAGDALAPAVQSAARQADGGNAGTGDAAEATGEPETPAATGEPEAPTESADEFEDRLDAREDAREDREKAREDALDAQEDREDD